MSNPVRTDDLNRVVKVVLQQSEEYNFGRPGETNINSFALIAIR